MALAASSPWRACPTAPSGWSATATSLLGPGAAEGARGHYSLHTTLGRFSILERDGGESRTGDADPVFQGRQKRRSATGHWCAAVPSVAVAAACGRSHSEARVGCIVWSTTASSSPV